MKQVSDKEIYVGENRVYLGEDNILYYTGVGEINDEVAIKIKEIAIKLVNRVEGKVDVLLDHNRASKPSSKSRAIFKELTEYEKFGKIAHFGIHPVAMVLASFVMGVSSKKKDMRFFETKEEALAWLKK